MARRLRIQFPGAIYHVTARGVERRRIFVDDVDRTRFLTQLGATTRACHVRLYLYCLMANHVHLVLETELPNLSQFMHRLETAYAVYFNLRHRRAGHLLQGRYGAVLVQGDDYLLRLSRYVHLNPVRTARLKSASLREKLDTLNNFCWSSYRGYVGHAPQAAFVDEEPLLRLGAGDSPMPRLAYRQYLEAGLASQDSEIQELMRSSSLAVGNSDFREKIQELHDDLLLHARCKEDVAFRRQRAEKSAAQILTAVANVWGVEVGALRRRQYRCPARAVAARMLWAHAGLNQRQIGRLLQMGTGASVSAHLRRLERAMATDPKLQARCAVIDSRLNVDC